MHHGIPVVGAHQVQLFKYIIIVNEGRKKKEGERKNNTFNLES